MAEVTTMVLVRMQTWGSSLAKSGRRRQSGAPGRLPGTLHWMECTVDREMTDSDKSREAVPGETPLGAVLSGVEELRPEARLVPVLVPADGDEITLRRELEGDLADASSVDHGGVRLADRLPLEAILGALEEREHVARPVVVAHVAGLPGHGPAADVADLDVPRDLAFAAHLAGRRPGRGVRRGRAVDVQRMEGVTRRLQGEVVEHQLPAQLEEQHLAEVAAVGVGPLLLPVVEVFGRDHDQLRLG